MGTLTRLSFAFAVGLTALSGVLAQGCSSTMGGSEAYPSDGAGSSRSGGGSSSGGATDASGRPGGGASAQGVQAGTLTAGAWDDNRNFSWFLQYRSKVAAAHPVGILPIDENEHREANTFHMNAQAGSAKTKLDIAVALDTTGSMGDEIRYLQTEFDALSRRIQSTYPNAEQRWSLVLYKDAGDAYLVQVDDFFAKPQDFATKLQAAGADGGGDTPEAAAEALDAATKLSWRADANVAKLLFWVADAPHHDDKAQLLAGAVRRARDTGVHVYPVASSGIDEFTELTMRSTAQLSGGRYLFLTNDSGVGGDHKEPSTPCYFVTKLDKAILRMVDIEMTGVYREPDAADILRKGGDPKSGVCKIGDIDATIY